MNALAINIIHPEFEKLKRTGRFLHLTAAVLIGINAFTQYNNLESNALFFWCQIVIAVDIIILLFTCNNLAHDLPKINLTFRFIECVMFLGVAILLLLSRKWSLGTPLFLVGLAYCYLFYCEKKTTQRELIAFHHTGLAIAGIPEGKFFLWSQIERIEARYDSISIETSFNKTFVFSLRHNLVFEELEQIHEFCRYYLGQGDC